MKYRRLAALLVCLIAAAFLLPEMPAYGANCAQIANREARQRSADVLNVREQDRGGRTICVIRLRVPGNGGNPPRVETIRAEP